MVFEDYEGVCDYIQTNKLTSNQKHVQIPLRYQHELQELGFLECTHCSGSVTFADMLTKRMLGHIHHEDLQNRMGYKYYPSTSYIHFYLLSA